MTIYFIKAVLLSGLFYIIFVLLLSKERSFKFNRFYLLATLALAYFIPFIKIPFVTSKSLVIGELIEIQNSDISRVSIQQVNVIEGGDVNYIFVTLVSISLFLVVRFGRNLFSIIKIKGEEASYKGIRLLKVDHSITPFSFWKTIFINKQDYIDIDEKILIHEKAHIQEKHSLDLIFLELLICFSWFNPFLYLIRKKMKENHEYMADQKVIQYFPNQVSLYQQLLLNKILDKSRIRMTHQFYNTTKNRFNMMNRTKKQNIWKLSIATISVLGLIFLGAEKIQAAVQAPEIFKDLTNERSNKTVNVVESPNIDDIDIKKVLHKETNVSINTVDIAEQDTIKPIQKTVEEDIYDKVDEPAVPLIENGFNGFRRSIHQNFDVSKFDLEGMVKTEVFFVVEKDGSVSDVKAEGTTQLLNDEAVKAFLLANKGVKWKPGKFENTEVRSRFKLPITMSFEGTKSSKK